jgi:hypothetical protein
MSDQQQRTTWALDMFESFVQRWTPAAAHPHLAKGKASEAEVVRSAVYAIAPKDDSKAVIGYGVFQREIDADWDIRQRPSGYVHTLISAVFDKLDHAENAHQGACRRHPDNQYVICEIREVP